MNVVFSPQPLSAGFKLAVGKIIPSPQFITLSDVAKRKGILGRIRYLRSMAASSLALAFEDKNSPGFAPLMKAMAAIAPADKYLVIGPDLTVSSFNSLSAIYSGFQFGMALLSCQAVKTRSEGQLRRLAAEPRIGVSALNTGKIIYLHTDLWFGMKAGGSVAHVTGVLKAFTELGIPVEYHSALGFTGIDPRVAVHDLPQLESFGLPMELNLLRFNNLCLSALEPRRFDDVSFIYQRMSTFNYSGVILSRRLGVPLVLEYNGSEAWIAEHWGGGKMANHDLAVLSEDANLRHAHLVVTISDALRDELVERGVEPERIVTYPNCVDTEIFDPARFSTAEIIDTRKRLGINPDAIAVTFVGTFGRWHGAEVLAKAARRLAETDGEWMRNRKVVFLFVGDGATAPMVRDIMSSGIPKENYVIAGLLPPEKIPPLLAASDIFVSPHVKNADGSRFFGSPTKLFEYMAMGKGIVASELEQIGDILKPAVRGDDLPSNPPKTGEKSVAVLVEPGDVDQLAAGVKFLVDNPTWRGALGENARREAQSKYTWKRHVERIMEGVGRIASK